MACSTPPIYWSTGSQAAASFRIKGSVGGLAGKSDEVPRAVDEGVERIRLPPRLRSAGRAVHRLPLRGSVERVAGFGEVGVRRQHHGQLLARYRHDAAGVAMDHRDRRAPITLTRHAPVAQAGRHLGFSPALRLCARDHRALGVGDAHPVQEVRVHDRPVAGVGDIAVELRRGQLSVGHGRAAPADRICARKSRSRWSCAGTPKIAPVP